MTEVILQVTGAYVLVMTAGINTAWEIAATGAGIALILYAVYTVYNLARHGLDWFRQQAS